MKLFVLIRDEDETGISGTGTVAQGVIFDDGSCAMTWLKEDTSVTFYRNVARVIAIHGHGGKTRMVQVASYDEKEVEALVQNLIQDNVENVHVGWRTGTSEMYIWDQRERFAKLFVRVDLAEDSPPGE